MNKYDFTQTGGFPFDQEVMAFLQDNAELAAKAALLGGNFCILSGCTVIGDNASNGVMVVNGEVLPFVGGSITEKVIIVEEANGLIYEDAVSKPVEKIRYATFGDDGVTNYLWSNFKRNNPANGLIARVETLEKQWLTGDVKMINVTMEYMLANFDATGLGINERLGWKAMNGLNGTINMANKLPLGFNWANRDTPTENPGTNKGSAKIAVNQLPKFTPAGSVLLPWSGSATGLGARDSGEDSTTNPRDTARKVYKQGEIGGDQDYFPDSIILLYITKI